MGSDSSAVYNEDNNDASGLGTLSLGFSVGYYSWPHDDVFRLLLWVSENMPGSFNHLNKANVNAITAGAFPNHHRIKSSNVKNKLSNLKRRYVVLKQKLEKAIQSGNSVEIEKVQSKLQYFVSNCFSPLYLNISLFFFFFAFYFCRKFFQHCLLIECQILT